MTGHLIAILLMAVGVVIYGLLRARTSAAESPSCNGCEDSGGCGSCRDHHPGIIR